MLAVLLTVSRQSSILTRNQSICCDFFKKIEWNNIDVSHSFIDMDVHDLDWCTIYWNNNSRARLVVGWPALLVAVQSVPSLAYHSASVAVLCRLWWHNISSILLFILFFLCVCPKLFLLPAASLRKRRIGHGRHKLGLDTCIIINGQNLFVIFLAGRPWCLTHLEPAARAAQNIPGPSSFTT